MFQDDVYSAVKSDECIMEYGQHLFNRLGFDPAKHEYIRQKMWELGRLLKCSRTSTSLKTIEDHILPKNFMQVVEAVKKNWQALTMKQRLTSAPVLLSR